jgi:hypothetical protein
VETEFIRLEDSLLDDIALSFPSSERTLLVKSFARCCAKPMLPAPKNKMKEMRDKLNEVLDISGANINKVKP